MGSLISSADWTINIATAYQSNKVSTVRVDAVAKTTNAAWTVVATRLPMAADVFFYQGYEESHGAYKIKIDLRGQLYLSNRSGKTGVYIDTSISYIAQ